MNNPEQQARERIITIDDLSNSYTACHATDDTGVRWVTVEYANSEITKDEEALHLKQQEIEKLEARVEELESAAMPYYKLALASLTINNNDKAKDSNPIYGIQSEMITVGDSRRIIKAIANKEDIA